MIEIALFDVGETLIHEGEPFPGVLDALESIARFETASQRPFFLGIVSDYHLPAQPSTEEEILDLERRYRDEVLGPAGLSRFFEPFEQHVTLSSRAGVYKPARSLFDLALARSGVPTTLSRCLFVTENAQHLVKCQEYGITPVRFGPGGAFDDWADAPALLAEFVTPGQPRNLARALAPGLASRFGVVDFTPLSQEGKSLRGQANRLVSLHDPRLGALNGIHVELPAEVIASLGHGGRLESVATGEADPEAVADAVEFVTSLIRSRRVVVPGQQPPTVAATHSVQTDSAGRMRLVRRGYSAR